MSLKERVRELVEKEIKPYLMADGGDIDVIDVDESNGVVKVKLLGACRGCPLSMITLTSFVERYLRTRIPEVKRVEAVP